MGRGCCKGTTPINLCASLVGFDLGACEEVRRRAHTSDFYLTFDSGPTGNPLEDEYQGSECRPCRE